MKNIARYYPMALNVKNRAALVIGGGKVAERKVRALLDAGAFVKVVSPVLTPALRRLAKTKRIRWAARKVRRPDLFGAGIVIAATSDSRVNRVVSRWARKEGAPVNVVDKPALSDFISPALLRRGGAIIAVYTDGRDPVLSRDLKNFLKEKWDVFLSYRNRL